jgi:GNAT superfamily N-acetyltransferase
MALPRTDADDASNPSRRPPSLDTIIRLEEDRLRCSIGEIAEIAEPWLGGVLAAGPPGTWINAAIGAGVEAEEDAAPDDGVAVDRLIDFYRSRGVEPRIELVPQARPTLLAALARRGFVVRRFLNLFVRDLEARPPDLDAPTLAGVDFSLVDPSDAAACRRWAEVSARNFAPARELREGDVALALRIVAHPRCAAVQATLSGRLVGGAAFEIGPDGHDSPVAARHGRIAALFGAVVEPEWRRRGIQQALIEQRLRLAAERGLRFATISSHPGVATERTARRGGFELACTKVVLVRPEAGLLPASE